MGKILKIVYSFGIVCSKEVLNEDNDIHLYT